LSLRIESEGEVIDVMVVTIGERVSIRKPRSRYCAFAAGLTLLTTLVFGITPALRASQVAPMTTLKSRGGRAIARTDIMRPFVILQLAFGLVVLFVGGLLVLSSASAGVARTWIL
jgi:hypothetical protein